VSGQGAVDHEPAQRLGGGQARCAEGSPEQCWTHGFPAGPKGVRAVLPFFWGIWSFSKNQSAAKSLLAYLSQAASARRWVIASAATTCRAFEKLTTFKTWARKGRPRARSTITRTRTTTRRSRSPRHLAPHKSRRADLQPGHRDPDGCPLHKGEAMDKRLDWASKEIEGFMRN